MSMTVMPSNGSALVLTTRTPSPAARAQPLVELLEPVTAPERFAADDEEWRAEDTARQRGRDGVAQIAARFVALDAREHRGGIDVDRRCQRGHLRRRAELCALTPVAVERDARER